MARVVARLKAGTLEVPGMTPPVTAETEVLDAEVISSDDQDDLY